MGGRAVQEGAKAEAWGWTETQVKWNKGGGRSRIFRLGKIICAYLGTEENSVWLKHRLWQQKAKVEAGNVRWYYSWHCKWCTRVLSFS